MNVVRVFVFFWLTLAGWGQHLLLGQGPPNPTSDYPIHPVETSPIIGRLKTQIQSGDHIALATFWQEIRRSGGPVIDRINHDGHDVIVTFLWRGDRETLSVELLAPLQEVPGMPHLPLKRLSDSNVWYSSWKMPDDVRFTYRLIPSATVSDRRRVTVPDPLNPSTMTIPFEDGTIPATELAIASMPRAPTEKWITKQPNVPKGSVVEQVVNGGARSGQRKIWVYTPAAYDQKTQDAYPLLVLFDGFSYLHWIPTSTILDNLIHAGRIPPLVAVLIDNPPNTRSTDLGYNTEFVEYIGNQLVPWIRKHYTVTQSAGRTIIGGYSDGGAAAAFTAMKRPDLFGKVLSQSGSFWEGHGAVKWEFLATQYAQTGKLSLDFFIEAGLLESVAKDGPSLLVANRDFVEILRKKNYEVTYQEVGGTHEPVHWRDTLPDGLILLTKDF